LIHQAVLLEEVLELMDFKPGMTCFDGTAGAAGHASAILRKVSPGGFLLGIDRDPRAVELARRVLMDAGFPRGVAFEVEMRRFSELSQALADRRLSGFDRIFADLGICSWHVDDPERGFSFRSDGVLDMRMNPGEVGSRSAAQVVNEASQAELERILLEYGEERWARRIASAIVRERKRGPIATTLQLREIVAGAVPRGAWPPNKDVATRSFLALRVAVNAEYEELDALLAQLPEALVPGGRAGIITFQSLEDRRVKLAFREMCRGCICPPEFPVCGCGRSPRFRLVNTRPVVATEEEVKRNPRARSAKLRVVERLAAQP
jgi:16S rRNA (cytosine1402-N4)-methyltransferase